MSSRKKSSSSSRGRILDSDEESIEEDISDDDLLADFNATSKPKTSYLKSTARDREREEEKTEYRERDDMMMKTMRKPWQPAGGKRSVSPRARRDDLSVDREERQRERVMYEEVEQEQRTRSKSRERTESRSGRSKSPGSRSPRSLRESIESVDLDDGRKTPVERPKPRQRKSLEEKRDDDDDDDLVIRTGSRASRGRTADRVTNHRSDSPHHDQHDTRAEGRRSFAGRRTPPADVDRLGRGDHKSSRSGSGGRQSPEDEPGDYRKSGGRRTPEGEKKSGRNSPPRPASRASASPRERRRSTVTDPVPSPKPRKSLLDYMDDTTDVPVFVSGRAHNDDDERPRSRQSDRHNRSHRNSRDSTRSDAEAEFVEMISVPKSEDKKKEENESKNSDRSRAQRSEVQITERQKLVNETLELVSNAQNSPSPVTHSKSDQIKKPPREKNANSSLNKTVEMKPPPRSRYAQPRPPSARERVGEGEGSNFGSTTDIRNAIFDEWNREAQRRKKQQQIEEKRRQESKLEKVKTEKDDSEKQLLAQASYNAWMETKKSFVKNLIKKKKDEEEKKRAEEEEKRQKKKDAEMNFLKWKERKDSELQENHHKKKKQEQEKERMKRDEEHGKQLESESAYNKWMEKKEEDMRIAKREAREQEQTRRDMERSEQEDRKTDSHRLYLEWLQQKEDQQEVERRRKLYEEEEKTTKRPWRPSSHTIQFGRA